jgi:hypothetical protein
MAIPDPLATLRTILGLDTAIVALAATRIFVGELPETEAAAQPRAAVLLQYAGGSPEPGRLAVGRPRVDARSYGRTPLEAQTLSWAVHDALKNLTRRVAAASGSGTRALIHAATPNGGPTLLRDADGQWPMVLRTYELLVAEVAAP